MIASITCIAQPTRATKALLGTLDPKMKALVDRSEAVDALAKLLTEAIETRTAKDGRIDMRDVASHVLTELGRHPK